MAATLVNIAFAQADYRESLSGSRVKNEMPALIASSGSVENIATPTTAKSTVATANANDVARILPIGGDVYALAGASPVASAGDWLVIAGTTLVLAVAASDKISVIDR